MTEVKFHILLRKPKYPLIVISSNRLYSAFDIQELAQACVNSSLSEGETYIKAIDSSGEEFWYTPEKYVICPGFVCKNWTKMKIIELYNEKLGKNQESKKYSTKSLSAKRLEKIVFDISNLLK